MDEYEIESTANNIYMPRRKINFLQVVTPQGLMMQINILTTF